MPTSSKLPADLYVDLDKIEAYLLAPGHRDGASKARYFYACGFTTREVTVFINALLLHARSRPAKRVTSIHGTKFTIEAPLMTPSGSTDRNVRSVWLQRFGEDFARLVTAYPL